MNERLKSFLDQMHHIWREMNFSAKFMSVSFMVGAVIALIVWASWIQTEEFGLLYSGRDTKEVGEVVNYLRDNDIAYKIKDRGMSVYVPTNRIYDSKLNLATEGLLRRETGFEIFDQVKFGMTSFAQQVNYRRALQGELARTISEMDPIQSANVQIVIPEKSLFIEEDRKPTASIVLKLKSRSSLAPSQVAGIVQLVAASVEGLNNNNVIITDNRGNLLTTKEQSTIISRNNEQLSLRKSIEDYYVSKATDIVSKILGAGKVIIKVSADMEYKNIDEKHVIYDPSRKVPKSQKIITRVSGGGSRGGGSPGTDSNIRQVGLVQEVGISEEEETIQTEYEVSRVERLVTRHGGVLQRLSVAILVDGRYETIENDDGDTLRKYVPLPESTLTTIGALVKSALGISDERGDTLEIKNLQFAVEEFGVDDFVAERNPFVQTLMDNISIIITLFTFIAFALMVMRTMRARVHKQVVRIEAGLSVDETKGVTTKDQLLADKLASEGIVLGPDGKPLSAGEKVKLDSEMQEIKAEQEYEGIKEGMIKSAAMKELLKKPSKDTNKDLEIFKDQVKSLVQMKTDGAANILKKWLAQ
ncbi:MAG: flagellar basal-body MS-ring/collar protein FliF [Candidatus Anammoxibacter sp.]